MHSKYLSLKVIMMYPSVRVFSTNTHNNIFFLSSCITILQPNNQQYKMPVNDKVIISKDAVVNIKCIPIVNYSSVVPENELEWEALHSSRFDDRKRKHESRQAMYRPLVILKSPQRKNEQEWQAVDHLSTFAESHSYKQITLNLSWYEPEWLYITKEVLSVSVWSDKIYWIVERALECEIVSRNRMGENWSHYE